MNKIRSDGSMRKQRTTFLLSLQSHPGVPSSRNKDESLDFFQSLPVGSEVFFKPFLNYFSNLCKVFSFPTRRLYWASESAEYKQKLRVKSLKSLKRETDGRTERLSFRWFSFYIIRVSRCELLFVQDEIHYWLQYEPEQYFIRRIWQGEILRWCRELSARTADQQGLQVNRCDCRES